MTEYMAPVMPSLDVSKTPGVCKRKHDGYYVLRYNSSLSPHAVWYLGYILAHHGYSMQVAGKHYRVSTTDSDPRVQALRQAARKHNYTIILKNTYRS